MWQIKLSRKHSKWQNYYVTDCSSNYKLFFYQGIDFFSIPENETAQMINDQIKYRNEKQNNYSVLKVY